MGRARARGWDHGAGPCLNDVGFVGGVGANTSAIFGDRSESAEERDAQTIANVGIEGCVGFSRTVSTNPCNTSRSSLPARASPTGEGGLSDAFLRKELGEDGYKGLPKLIKDIFLHSHSELTLMSGDFEEGAASPANRPVLPWVSYADCHCR